jgi:hypothetical protein
MKDCICADGSVKRDFFDKLEISPTVTSEPLIYTILELTLRSVVTLLRQMS